MIGPNVALGLGAALGAVLVIALRYAAKVAGSVLDLARLREESLAGDAEKARAAQLAADMKAASLIEELGRARTDLADARAHAQSLLTQIVELRRDGFALPPGTPLAPPSPNEMQQRDPFAGVIRNAIEARARNRTEVAAMERFAADLRTSDVEDDNIARQIMRGANLMELV